MKKVLLFVVIIIVTINSTLVGATDLLSPIAGHYALWVEGSISHDKFINCVENFTPPYGMGECLQYQEGYDKFFRSYADEFYYISLAMNLDPRYVFCLGLQETYYGTSTLANSKNNIFCIDSISYGINGKTYDSVPYSIFDVCYILHEYASEKSWQYKNIVQMGYNPKTIEGQQAMYTSDSSSAAQILSIMEEIFPSQWEIIVKMY